MITDLFFDGEAYAEFKPRREFLLDRDTARMFEKLERRRAWSEMSWFVKNNDQIFVLEFIRGKVQDQDRDKIFWRMWPAKDKNLNFDK